MKGNMRTVILFLTLFDFFACVRYETPPAAPHNLASDFTAQFVPQLSPNAKCTPWTGHGTTIPGVDSVLCKEATAILYCSAPTDKSPKCESAIDWTPRAAPPAPNTSALPQHTEPIEPPTAKMVRDAKTKDLEAKKPEAKKP